MTEGRSTWARVSLWTLAAVGTIAAGFLLRPIVEAIFPPELITAAGVVAITDIEPAAREIVDAKSLLAPATAVAAGGTVEVEPSHAAAVAENLTVIEPSVNRSLSRDRVQDRKLALLEEAAELVKTSDLSSETTQRRIDEILMEVDRLEEQLRVFAESLSTPQILPKPTSTVAIPQTSTPRIDQDLRLGVPTVHLRISAGMESEKREQIEAMLAKAGYVKVVVHEMPFSISRSRVAYFRDSDRLAAEALLKTLRPLGGFELRDYRKLMAAAEPGRLDLWIES